MRGKGEEEGGMGMGERRRGGGGLLEDPSNIFLFASFLFGRTSIFRKFHVCFTNR